MSIFLIIDQTRRHYLPKSQLVLTETVVVPRCLHYGKPPKNVSFDFHLGPTDQGFLALSPSEENTVETACQTITQAIAVPRRRPILRLPMLPTNPIIPKVRGRVSYLLPGPQNYIHHPDTELPVFGYVPSLPTLTGHDSCVPVVLTKGHQANDGTGLGAAHSWAQHRADIEALGGRTAEDTALLVARVIVEGTPLYFESGYRSQTRLVAYRPGAGTVVLGLFNFRHYRRWQVITAHGGRGYLGNYIAEISEARPVQHMC